MDEKHFENFKFCYYSIIYLYDIQYILNRKGYNQINATQEGNNLYPNAAYKRQWFLVALVVEGNRQMKNIDRF